MTAPTPWTAADLLAIPDEALAAFREAFDAIEAVAGGDLGDAERDWLRATRATIALALAKQRNQP